MHTFIPAMRPIVHQTSDSNICGRVDACPVFSAERIDNRSADVEWSGYGAAPLAERMEQAAARLSKRHPTLTVLVRIDSTCWVLTSE